VPGEAPGSLAPLVVVMPALDEAASIGDVLEQVRTQILDRVAGSRAVVADDGSRDDTPRLLAQIAAADPRIGVLRARAPTGQGPATRRAIESAPAQWYLHMDSDGQVDVSDFAALWALRDEADLVLGVRRRRRDPPHRMVITRATRGLVSRIAGRPLHDAATPLRLIRGTLWDDLRPFVGPQTMSFSILVSVAAVRRGWRVAELDVSHHPRQSGRSRLQGLGMLRMIAKGMLELRTLTRATSGGRDDDAPR
jgi:glycosyltransferase involved in cell wall biosynthesis